MADALIELFSEEIPARMQKSALQTLTERVEKELKEARLEHDAIKGFMTPRRLALHISGLPAVQPDIEIERKGPKVGAPEQALQGFCRSAGLEPDQLEKRTVGKDEFYFSVSSQKGQPTSAALKDIFETAITNFPWPKSQHWGSYDMTWVRPLKRIMCLLDAEVIPVQLGHITASNITEGHRFLSEGEIVIAHPNEYEATLKEHKVVADAQTRREWILGDAAKAAGEKGLSIKADDALLDEVTGLVEWPVCLLGEYDKDFLKLPPEVLVLEMKHHQKYFACMNDKAELSNHFLVVSNMAAADGGKAIVNGNQRVIRARLSDGQFYWDQDQKKPLASFNDALDKMIFHAKLGSIAKKVERITSLSTFLSVFIPHANLSTVERAAELAKSDLVSGMVGEFPELQGIMGRYYAKAQGEDADVAEAIAEHYKPQGADDSLPETPAGLAVSLADKFDSLAGLFAAGEKPTGSKDPFALRRMALGILRIILDNKLRIPLTIAFDNALSRYPKAVTKTLGKEAVTNELTSFFRDRLKVILKSNDVRHDVIECIFADAKADDIVQLVSRIYAVEDFIKTDDGTNLLAGYRRAANILNKEEEKDNTSYDGDVEADDLTEAAEKALLEALEKIEEPVEQAFEKEEYENAMKQLASIRPPLDAFFDDVIVNDDDTEKRANRLALLAKLRLTLERIGNLSLIEI